MSALGAPTVVVPVGPAAEAAVRRVLDTLGEADPLLVVHRLDEGEDALAARLGELLRVGRAGQVAEPRLDAFAFVDLTAPGDPTERLRAPCERVSRVIAGSFGRVFPAERSPEQRTAGLHVIAFVPALVAGERANAALDGLQALLDWSASAPHPTLARVWLCAAQTAAGVLTPDDLASQGAGFALSLLGGGVRDAEPARARLAHPAPGVGPVGFASVASLDVPVGRIEAWARAAAAWSALDHLVGRVAPRAGGPTHPALPPARLDEWLRPFVDGPPAERLKAAAWRAAGASELPERVHVGATESAASVRARYAALFTPPRAERRAGADEPAVRDALLALDAAHSAAVHEFTAAIEGPLRGALGEPHPLSELPSLEQSLEQLLARAAPPPPDDTAAPEAVDDGSRAALEREMTTLPSPGSLALAGIAVGLACATAAFAISAAVLLAAPSAPAAPATTTVIVAAGPVAGPALRLAQVAPWGLAGLAGLLTGALSLRGIGAASRRALVRALEARRDALIRDRQAGAGALAPGLARDRLALHQRRLRRTARVAAEAALERLRLARAALLECRDALQARLDALGARPSAGGGPEDYALLLAGETHLHARLIGPESARAWVRRARRFADAKVLADRLVDGTLDTDGLVRDVPAADPDAVIALAAAQTAGLASTSLFDDPPTANDAAARAERFAAQIAVALAPGNTPLGPEGTPARGIRPGELFTVGPAEGRAALEAALSRSRAPVSEALWSPSTLPALVFVRTWEGLSVDDVRRGCGGSR